MTPVEALMPAPGAALDWDVVDAAFPWIRALRGAPHDPVHHREGDVWIHTRMVVEALLADPEWQGLGEGDRLVAFAAALLHDVAKPATAVVESGRVGHPGHSRLGAVMARGILWRMGFAPAAREKVCALIARHQVPFWLWEKPFEQARRVVAGQSLTSGNALLVMLARADARGRICDDRGMLEEGVALYRALAEEHECLDGPFAFAGDQERFLYLSERATLDPRYPMPSAGAAPEVTVMSALPASGKTTWIARHGGGLPVVSLDALRATMRIGPDEAQAPVIEAAREAAKGYLRQRRPFVWDATNISREMRGRTIALCHDYGFRIRMVSLEAPPQELARRNRERDQPVPQKVIDRLVDKWEFPGLDEAAVRLWPAGD